MGQEEHFQSVGYTDKCRWPFRKHPAFGRVYAPWGPFGTQYALADLREYRRVKKQTDSIGTLSLFLQFLLQADRWIHGTLGKYLPVAVFTFAFYIFRQCTRHAAKGLMVAEEGNPLWRAFAIAGRDSALWQLWLGNLLFVGLTCLIALLPRTKGHLSTAEWILASLFALGATLFSLMIFFHHAPIMVNPRRVPVRR